MVSTRSTVRFAPETKASWFREAMSRSSAALVLLSSGLPLVYTKYLAMFPLFPSLMFTLNVT